MPSDKPDSFQCGPFEVAKPADVNAFAEKLNRMREAVDRNRLMPGVGYDVIRSSGGTALSIRNNGSISEHIVRPFQLKYRKHNNQHQAYVGYGVSPDQNIEFENIEEWITFEPPAHIYLAAAIDGETLGIESLYFDTSPVGDVLDPVTVEEGQQTLATIVIGTVKLKEGSDTAYEIIQNVTTNLYHVLEVYYGYAVVALRQQQTYRPYE